MNRIPTIDGWRGVAILMVLVSHSDILGRFSDHFWGGVFGVDLFFVLSGYIITARLLEEIETDGVLRRFYFRRAFRILPPVFAYLLVVSAISCFFRVVSYREVLASLFFFRNYQLAAHEGGIYTSHFWSLSIEEHFYLLWPALLLWARPRRAVYLAIGGAMSCAAWRLYDSPTSLMTRLFPAGQVSAFNRVIRTDERMDGLLLGCAMAILLTHQPVREFIFRNFPKEAPILCAFPLVLILDSAAGWPKLSIYLLLAIAVSSTLIVKEGLAYQWLNFRPLVWIGQLSYSLYIWQQLFLFQFWHRLFLARHWVFPLSGAPLLAFNLICVVALAAVSFYFIEQPSIAFGKRLLRQKLLSRVSAEDHCQVSPAGVV